MKKPLWKLLRPVPFRDIAKPIPIHNITAPRRRMKTFRMFFKDADRRELRGRKADVTHRH